jgi:hypothetical protein
MPSNTPPIDRGDVCELFYFYVAIDVLLKIDCLVAEIDLRDMFTRTFSRDI